MDDLGINADDLYITVIVVLFNSAALLPGLLASLGPGLAGLRYELFLVDNASSDGSAALARELAPDATVIEVGRNAGYAAGINAGLRAARHRGSTLVMNPDVRLGSGCVAALQAGLAEPGVGIAVPRLADGRGELIFSMRREPTVLRAVADALVGAERAGRIGELGEMVSDARRYSQAQTTDWPEGSLMLISRECIESVGGWDESFFLYSEETEFALRCRDRGFGTRFLPSAQAVHLEGGSANNPALWALVAKNRVTLFRRRHGRVESAAFYVAVVAREATRALLGRPTSKAALRVLLSPTRMREPAGPWSVAVR